MREEKDQEALFSMLLRYYKGIIRSLKGHLNIQSILRCPFSVELVMI